MSDSLIRFLPCEWHRLGVATALEALGTSVKGDIL
jgi:hypothetical protein